MREHGQNSSLWRSASRNAISMRWRSDISRVSLQKPESLPQPSVMAMISVSAQN